MYYCILTYCKQYQRSNHRLFTRNNCF